MLWYKPFDVDEPANQIRWQDEEMDGWIFGDL